MWTTRRKEEVNDQMAKRSQRSLKMTMRERERKPSIRTKCGENRECTENQVFRVQAGVQDYDKGDTKKDGWGSQL